MKEKKFSFVVSSTPTTGEENDLKIKKFFIYKRKLIFFHDINNYVFIFTYYI